MAFQSLQDYNEQKYGDWFVLLDDGDSADVVFLYQKESDALMATVHYLKSLDYNGYVHCTGAGCPACGRGIRTQAKFFIPLYNLNTGRVEFWDRTDMFIPQFKRDVFQNYPNPSEYIFRITRHGAFRSRDTRYSIMVVSKNEVASMDAIVNKFNLKFPDVYSEICKECSIPEMQTILNNQPEPQQNNYQGGYQQRNSYGNNSYGGNSYNRNSYGGGYGNSTPNYQVSARPVVNQFGVPPVATPMQSTPLVAPANNDIPDEIDEEDVEF